MLKNVAGGRGVSRSEPGENPLPASAMVVSSAANAAGVPALSESRTVAANTSERGFRKFACGVMTSPLFGASVNVFASIIRPVCYRDGDCGLSRLGGVKAGGERG